MSGILGATLSLLTIAAVFILRPESALGLPASAMDLSKVALLLCLAALSSVLGLLSPRWSASRVAAVWGSVLAAVVTISVNMNTLTDAALHGVASGNARQDIRVGTGNVRLRHSIMPERDDALPLPGSTEANVLLMAAQTEIRASQGGHFITTADIDYTPIRVLIDTGATLVAMSYADADKAGLHPFSLDYSVPVSTANGVVKAAPATLKRVEVDNIVVYDVKALVLPKGAFNGTLLGMSFLSRLSSFGIRDGVLTLEE